MKGGRDGCIVQLGIGSVGEEGKRGGREQGRRERRGGGREGGKEGRRGRWPDCV